MSGSTELEFNEINLHDARVAQVRHEGEDIILSLPYAYFTARHPSNPHGVTAMIRDCELTFRRVSKSTALLYDDARKAFVAHLRPDSPLVGNIVESRSSDSGDGAASYSIGGMDDRDVAWVEWSVTAAGFTLTWKGAVEKWQ